MKFTLNFSFLLLLLALSSCDSKSTDPINICVDAKIELYIQSKSLTEYCSSLKIKGEFAKGLSEHITQQSQSGGAVLFSKNLIKQHDEKVKLCSNPTVSNFKKLDIRDDSKMKTRIILEKILNLDLIEKNHKLATQVARSADDITAEINNGLLSAPKILDIANQNMGIPGGQSCQMKLFSANRKESS